MDPLLDALMARGVLDGAAAEWTRSYVAGRGGSVDTALLELDLVDEDDLGSALSAIHGLAPAPADVRLDPTLAARLPAELSNACPVRIFGNRTSLIVTEPIPNDILPSAERSIPQLIAPSHHVRWARSVVYDDPVDERTKSLQSRLARKRNAPDVHSVLEELSTVSSLAHATTVALEFAASFLEFSCLLMCVGEEVRVLASRSPHLASRTVVAAPGSTCSFAPAIRFGGYFVGSIAGTDAGVTFFDSLGRAQPRWAFVAPVPIVPGRSVVFFGDNGQRGMATRWIAKLTLIASGLGQQGGRLGIGASSQAAPSAEDQGPADQQRAVESDPVGQAEIERDDQPPELIEPSVLQLTAGETRAVGRLRRQADIEGLSVERLVDALLRDRTVVPEAGGATALLGEVKGLFEQLAASLPSQLAQGIESAMRDMTPKTAALPPAQAPPAPAAEASSKVDEIVAVKPAKREVANYRSLRKKASRLKL